MMTPEHAESYYQPLLAAFTRLAMEEFEERVAPVRRVAIKINPAVRGQFLVMVSLIDGQRYEGRAHSGKRCIEWCLLPHCNCIGFARTRSPLELGATIED